jgi:hypothetical protein
LDAGLGERVGVSPAELPGGTLRKDSVAVAAVDDATNPGCKLTLRGTVKAVLSIAKSKSPFGRKAEGALFSDG